MAFLRSASRADGAGRIGTAGYSLTADDEQRRRRPLVA